MSEPKSRRLGKGLAALIGETAEESLSTFSSRQSATLSIDLVAPNTYNPRQTFIESELEELTESIKAKGIIQPVLVRQITGNNEKYEIIAGERRWRAAQRANLHEIPVHIVNVNDQDALEFAIIENIQRSDLNPIEEALGYSRLIEQFHYTQEDLGASLGKSRSHIANTLRLLKLPLSVKNLVASGQLSAGHARALITVDNAEEFAQKIVDEGLSVRDTEKLLQNKNETATKQKNQPQTIKDPDTKALEEALGLELGMTVNLHPSGEGGEIRIRYSTLEQLDALCKRLRS